MKTRKFTKLAAVVLALALVFSAFVGVSVYAADGADEGAATITNKNVDHGVELALCFAVEEGTVAGTLYVLVWDWNYSGEYTYETAEAEGQVKSAIGTVTIDEVSKKLFVANSVAAKDLDEQITFRTCIVKEDGSCVYGALESYSILDYTTQRLSEIPNQENLTDAEKATQTNICNAIIRYNAAAEAIFED